MSGFICKIRQGAYKLKEFYLKKLDEIDLTKQELRKELFIFISPSFPSSCLGRGYNYFICKASSFVLSISQPLEATESFLEISLCKNPAS